MFCYINVFVLIESNSKEDEGVDYCIENGWVSWCKLLWFVLV